MRTGIIEHEAYLGMVKQRLRGQSCGSIRGAHSSIRGQAFTLDAWIAVHHPNCFGQPKQVALQQFDGVDDYNATDVREFFEPHSDHSTDLRMDNILKARQSVGVGKDKFGEARPIHRAILCQYLPAEGRRDPRSDRRTRRHKTVYYLVGVDARSRAQRQQEISYGCFAATDRACEPEDACSCLWMVSVHCC